MNEVNAGIFVHCNQCNWRNVVSEYKMDADGSAFTFICSQCHSLSVNKRLNEVDFRVGTNSMSFNAYLKCEHCNNGKEVSKLGLSPNGRINWFCNDCGRINSWDMPLDKDKMAKDKQKVGVYPTPKDGMDLNDAHTINSPRLGEPYKDVVKDIPTEGIELVIVTITLPSGKKITIDVTV